MTVPAARVASECTTTIVAVAGLLALAPAYTALCLIVLHRSEWLPSGSILHASLVGPPHWLVWGSGGRPVFWGSTLAMAVVAGLGASFRSLLLPCAGLCFLIWLGAGFLSVAMSV